MRRGLGAVLEPLGAVLEPLVVPPALRGTEEAAGEEDAALSPLSHQVSPYLPPFPSHFLPSLGFVFISLPSGESRHPPEPTGGFFGAAASWISPPLPGKGERPSPPCPSPGSAPRMVTAPSRGAGGILVEGGLFYSPFQHQNPSHCSPEPPGVGSNGEGLERWGRDPGGCSQCGVGGLGTPFLPSPLPPPSRPSP